MSILVRELGVRAHDRAVGTSEHVGCTMAAEGASASMKFVTEWSARQ